MYYLWDLINSEPGAESDRHMTVARTRGFRCSGRIIFRCFRGDTSIEYHGIEATIGAAGICFLYRRITFCLWGENGP